MQMLSHTKWLSSLVLGALLYSSPLRGQTVYGPNNPSTSANDASIGSLNWSNPVNSLTSNNTRSNVNPTGTSRYLTTTNYGFSIPAGATVEGIMVEVERRSLAPTDAVEILDGWTTGLSKTISAGTDRCLIVIASTENGDGPTDVTGITYGGQAMTQVGEFNIGTAGGFNNRLDIWMLLEAGIAAAGSTTLAPNLSATSFLENIEIYSSVVLEYVDQYNPVYDIQSSSVSGDVVPYQLASAVGTLASSLMVTAITCGNNTNPPVAIGGTNTYSVNSGFVEGTDEYFADPSFNSGGCLQTATKQSSGVGTEQPEFTFAGDANRQVAVAFTLRSATGVDNSIRLIKGGTITGNNNAKTNVGWPTGDTYESYGGPTDLWGTTWTPAEINAIDFGVAVSAINQGNNLQIDHVRITVYTAVILPIELLYFRGEMTEDGVVLQWETTTELNNDYFTVERSGNGVSFEPVLRVPGGGTTNMPVTYSALDSTVKYNITYYRLKQTDFDLASTYSNVISVNTNDGSSSLIAYPNPANTEIMIRSLSDLTLGVRIVNMAGVIVFESTNSISTGTIDVSSVPPGFYLIELSQGAVRKRQKIVIDR